ncbi:NAD(P)H-binding protein [Nocardia sp. NPDC050710]|uniref:SDR family oxidoreductase n=1 Tax=Nocardia sp. NPDC050710 TaxID=3157220 RepID=UPI003406178D
MILLTGGRGAVATTLLGLLRADQLDARVGSARPEGLELPADVPTVACDLTDPATFPAALAGVTSVFLYAEPAHIAEFVTTAAQAGVQHIVLLSSSSVLDPDAATNPVAKSHLAAERGLADAPMTVSVLRPGAFASNARGGPGRSPRTGRSACRIRMPTPTRFTNSTLPKPRTRSSPDQLIGANSITSPAPKPSPSAHNSSASRPSPDAPSPPRMSHPRHGVARRPSTSRCATPTVCWTTGSAATAYPP